MPTLQSQPIDPAALLDVDAVAALLDCSPRHVWRMSDAGDFPRPLSIGKKLKRWPRSTVLAYLAGLTPTGTRR